MEAGNTKKSGYEIPFPLRKLIIPTSFRTSLSSSDIKTVLTSENRNVLLVAATLIAAATFQAGVNPPGGVWQQDYAPQNVQGYDTMAPMAQKVQGYDTMAPMAQKVQGSSSCNYSAGEAIYSCHTVPFHVFLISNTLAFTSSVFLLLCLTYGYPFFLEVFIASVSMVITYGSSIYAITPYERGQFRLVFISAAGTLLLRLFISLAAKVIRKIPNKDPVETAPTA